MTESDREKFAIVMNGLASNGYGVLSPEGLELRWRALINWPIEKVEQVAGWLLVNRRGILGKTFPPIPDVEEFFEAEERISGKPSAKEMAVIQAEAVISAISVHGRYYMAPKFKDAITARLMAGRWLMMCDMQPSDQAAWKKGFVESYVAISRHPAVAEICYSGLERKALPMKPREDSDENCPKKINKPFTGPPIRIHLTAAGVEGRKLLLREQAKIIMEE